MLKPINSIPKRSFMRKNYHFDDPFAVFPLFVSMMMEKLREHRKGKTGVSDLEKVTTGSYNNILLLPIFVVLVQSNDSVFIHALSIVMQILLVSSLAKCF